MRKFSPGDAEAKWSVLKRRFAVESRLGPLWSGPVRCESAYATALGITNLWGLLYPLVQLQGLIALSTAVNQDPFQGLFMQPAADFHRNPILNSPYRVPNRHWELDEHHQPTLKILPKRREASFITPVPKPKKGKPKQGNLEFGASFEHHETRYDPNPIINALRPVMAAWRESAPSEWHVTPETASLLRHWRNFEFSRERPFFCQLEAIETLIWLSEVAPDRGSEGQVFREHLNNANLEANPELFRIALKMATGSGKTTVMAMIIAWQTINALRHPRSPKFARSFLIVTPGITIRDRLQVLLPQSENAIYRERELVPTEWIETLGQSRIVITNYHSFKRRELLNLSAGGRALLQGRGPELSSLESEGQMLQRVMPELVTAGRVLVLNDEAHHCYRERPESEENGDLKGDERKEAEANNEAARLWISGLEALSRAKGGKTPQRVIDLSATPFFLQGSGYREGTLFPWTMSDFSLMDAIECGIVKLPRVPVADNIPGAEAPRFRNLWEHIRKKMPKGTRKANQSLDALKLPAELESALQALYGHYEKTFELWSSSGVKAPPCFIIVCNNTSTSKLIFDYVAGFERKDSNDRVHLEQGRLPLFRNFDERGQRLARPRTLLVDSVQLESDGNLSKDFMEACAAEIEVYRREFISRGGSPKDAADLDERVILRELMNTVGKAGKLGEGVRCVVSVAMLTEGWDTNTVTHILGVRAFGTQLLCEQVIGRALRRQSYELGADGLLAVEYADILGIPFDFSARPEVTAPTPPKEMTHVHAVSPERDTLEIVFPRVAGYRIDLQQERISASFGEDSKLTLSPEIVGPTITNNQGIIGEGVRLDLSHTGAVRDATVVFHLTQRLMHKWREPGEALKLHLFPQFMAVVKNWFDDCLECVGGTFPAQLLYIEIADRVCERISRAITSTLEGSKPVLAILEPYKPRGTTLDVNFRTSKGPSSLWATGYDRSHVNYAVCDSDWETELCRVLEDDERIECYVKNQALGFDVPYLVGSEPHRYRPDFIARVKDGQGGTLNLVLEVKGYRNENAKEKADTMMRQWIPGVNNLGSEGRWAFAELREVFRFEEDWKKALERALAEVVEASVKGLPS